MLKKILLTCSILLLALLIFISIVSYTYYQELNDELPDTAKLKDVQYQTPLTIYTRNAELIAQYGEKKRIPVTIMQVPDSLVNAFIAAEDDRFFEHPGVDYQGLIRAAIQLALTGKKKQGGSTITMQVVRNFLLSRKKTYRRKLKEILLALKIEREFSKEKILELYLNKIYLGHSAYGIAAAAQIYYGKTLPQLTLSEQAMLAGLPKAPSASNPVSNPTAAINRRNYVLGRMKTLNYISEEQYATCIATPDHAKIHKQSNQINAPYIAEMVRKEMFDLYGEEAYTSGFKVYTTIDNELQMAATHALRNNLHSYDQRHGYRKQSTLNDQAQQEIEGLSPIGDTYPAYILEINEQAIKVQLKNQQIIEIPKDNYNWIGLYKSRNYKTATLRSIAKVMPVGSIIRVRQMPDQTWAPAQIPEVQGAFVALDTLDGGILALTGGFDYFQSKFNRVTQSKRQPGSGFKPIVYTTALQHGYTAASIINDAPVVVDNAAGETWRPENYSHKFYGPTRLRTALRKSRNLISIRLLRSLGVRKVIATAQQFGFPPEQLPNNLSLALGSGSATPLQMARMFSVFANGGFLINPYFIDRIETINNGVIFQSTPLFACPECDPALSEGANYAPRIISPQVSFLMNSLLRDVVQRGTATKAKTLNRTDIGGKTGTTNEQRDAWFTGFAPGIVASSWVGMDNSQPLGRKETGGTAALPAWIDFMTTALKNSPEEQAQPMPPGITQAYINPDTGLQTDAENKNGVWEYFRSDLVPMYRNANQFSSHSNTEDNTLEESLF